MAAALGGIFAAGGGALAGRGALLGAGLPQADFLLLLLTPESLLGLPRVLEFPSDSVDSWDCLDMRSALHLRL